VRKVAHRFSIGWLPHHTPRQTGLACGDKLRLSNPRRVIKNLAMSAADPAFSGPTVADRPARFGCGQAVRHPDPVGRGRRC